MFRTLSLAVILCPLLILSACNEAPFEAERGDVQQADVTSQFEKRAPAETPLGAQLAAVRAATAKYHQVEEAIADGYVETPCVSDEDGGMGHHYVNFGLLGSLDALTPQALLYETMKNGRKRLGGVEYIALGSPEDEPPMLFGQEFHWNPHQGFWALHVWMWRNNPSGMFADWNPKVTCEYAN
jgi:hypothetical protein